MGGKISYSGYKKTLLSLSVHPVANAPLDEPNAKWQLRKKTLKRLNHLSVATAVAESSVAGRRSSDAAAAVAGLPAGACLEENPG